MGRYDCMNGIFIVEWYPPNWQTITVIIVSYNIRTVIIPTHHFL